jgi:hypothetical protein
MGNYPDVVFCLQDDPGGYVRVHNFYAGRFVDVR